MTELTAAYVIGVSSKLDHPSMDEQADSIAYEAKGSTSAGLLTTYLRSKPLVGGCV